MVESRTDANKELISYSQKEVKVRTPRRGRSKSIVVPGTSDIPRNFPIGRLNNYNKTMKKHKGPLSLASELESIEEDEFSDKLNSSRNEILNVNEKGNILLDVDKKSISDEAKNNNPMLSNRNLVVNAEELQKIL